MSSGAREQFVQLAHRYTTLIGLESGGKTFIVDSRFERVGRSLFMNGTRGEMATLARAVEVLRDLLGEHAIEGKTFTDVGANIGTSTVTALLSHAFAECVACEPDPENYRLLRLNVVANDLEERVITLPVAVSSKRGEAQLALSRGNSGAHRVVSRSGAKLARAKGKDVVTVRQVTLDSLVEEGMLDSERVGLIWIDAQGHEGHILSGGASLVARGTPIVLELDPAKLISAGGQSRLKRAVRDGYTHFVDLRTVSRKGGLRYELQPASNIGPFALKLKSSETRFTDILLVRRSHDQLPPVSGG